LLWVEEGTRWRTRNTLKDCSQGPQTGIDGYPHGRPAIYDQGPKTGTRGESGIQIYDLTSVMLTSAKPIFVKLISVTLVSEILISVILISAIPISAQLN
jgi:hypothetical protein